MKKIKHPRTLKLKKNYIPKKQINEELEIYKNGVFNFFISKILEDIENGIFEPKKERKKELILKSGGKHIVQMIH